MSEPLTTLEKALVASLDPGSFQDVCLYAFSRRLSNSDGTVTIGHPSPLFAVGSVLKKTEYFANLLDSGFSESCTLSGDDNDSKIPQSAQESDYDYDSDSDLDDDANLPTSAPDTESIISDGNRSAGLPTDSCRKIVIPNMAHRTLRALVFFMYTGKVIFLPLRSQGLEQGKLQVRTTQSLGHPACSPKSLYRLADAYGMKGLQDRALNAIMQRLSADNVVQEAFSSFFCRYEVLHERAVGIVRLFYGSPAVQESLRRIIPGLVRGEYPDSAPTLEALLQLHKLEPGKPQRWMGSSESTENAQSTPKSSPQRSSGNGVAQSFGWPIDNLGSPPRRPPGPSPSPRPRSSASSTRRLAHKWFFIRLLNGVQLRETTGGRDVW
ncbi:hypothetical protein C8Q80DRAFT_1270090 [Daedaleopsis nitida]|nr:hypothetical protein C8Q80DRAFT_1270090 [Daedaleopsis nitida]